MQTSPFAAAALGLALTACSDPGGVATETATQASTGAPVTTGDVPTTGTPTTTGTADTTGEPTPSSTTGTTGTPTTGEPSTGAGSSTGESCPEPLCGEPAVCCLDTEKCSEGVCVPSCGSSGGLEFLDVVIEWAWTVNESTVTPLVADIQGDPTPEVVVNAMRIDNISRDLGEIVALDGSTGAELWRIVDDPPKQRFGSHSLATPALADVDGDQRPDIIYAGRQDLLMYSLVHAVDGDGEHLWTGHTADDAPVAIRWDHGAAAVANLDDDPEAEVVIGGAIFDNDGLLVWNQDELGGQLGTPTDNKQPPKLLYVGGLPTLVDLTGDGKLELLTGREAWTIDWAPGPVVSLVLLWQSLDGKGNDGWPAVADLDQNGTPEVVLVAWPDIKVIDGATGKLWCGVDPTGVACEADEGLRTQPIKIEGGNLGGPAARVGSGVRSPPSDPRSPPCPTDRSSACAAAARWSRGSSWTRGTTRSPTSPAGSRASRRRASGAGSTRATATCGRSRAGDASAAGTSSSTRAPSIRREAAARMRRAGTRHKALRHWYLVPSA